MTKKQEQKIPEELQEKFKQIKTKVESLKTKILKEFDKYVIGIALLPPKNIEREKFRAKEEDDKELAPEEIEKLKNQINVLVLVDDSDSKKMSKEELNEKLNKIIDKFASDIDKNLNPQVILISELKEACFDGKYEILQLIAMSATLYDPKDMLAALKIAEVHKAMVIKKFEKYVVSYVAAGSLFRGEKSNDIDVYVIIDDTDVKRMPRYELKERLRTMIIGQGYEASQVTGVEKSFHIQVYILTDFWESIKDANPVIFTFLRDGVPLYDRSVFTPWRLLLNMGRIKPSAEAIDMQMDIGEKLLDRAKKKLLGIAAEDIYYAVLNPSQAALMLYGVNPPTPRETLTLMEEIFVKKEHLLEPKYVNILKEATRYFKDVEHGKVKEISGIQIEKLIKDSEDYLTRIKKLFNQIEKRKEKEDLTNIYDGCMKIASDVLRFSGVKETNLEKDFVAYCKSNGIPERLVRTFKEIIRIKNENKKLSKSEIEKVKREARDFMRSLVEYIQRKRGFELERAKIRFKHGNKVGEALLLDGIAFITSDLEAKEKEISKAKILDDGSLSHFAKSSAEELEDHISKAKIPEKVSIKEKTFESLKEIYGKDVEIIVNY